MEPAQVALLDRIMAGELIPEGQLRKAGAIRPKRDENDEAAAGEPGSAVDNLPAPTRR